MKTKLTFAALLVAALLAGCISMADKLNNIHIGMTRPDVIAQLGQPDSTSAQGNIEYLTYFLSNDATRTQPYAVRLVDQKVESFGRFAQLTDIYNRPVNGSAPMNGWAPTMVTGPAGAPAPDLVTQLQQLKQLKDQKVLTDEEFQQAKQKLLGAQD
jgi:hypothetical protein